MDIYANNLATFEQILMIKCFLRAFNGSFIAANEHLHNSNVYCVILVPNVSFLMSFVLFYQNIKERFSHFRTRNWIKDFFSSRSPVNISANVN